MKQFPEDTCRPHWRLYRFSKWLAIHALILGVPGCSRDVKTPPREVGNAKPSHDLDFPTNQATIVANTEESFAGRDTEWKGIPFVEVAQSVGVDFVYETGASGSMFFHETFGGGHGWLDFDLDGFVDLYLVQGGDGIAVDKTTQPSDQLYRNRGGNFRNITREASIVAREYGQGVMIADFDNDGFDDIYVTNLGANLFFRNQGDGTFEEIGKECRVDCPSWSSSAAWVDIDLDGNLDLYVCNYVEYENVVPRNCFDQQGNPIVCNPLTFAPSPDRLYWNDGKGGFIEVSRERGCFGTNNRALGVVAADFDQDGWPDLYVANDASNNFFFRNLGDGYFEEVAVKLGCATDRRGAPQASMGLAVNDYNFDGRLDIYATHFQSESNTLYKNLGAAGFLDVTGPSGLHTPTIDKLGFGTVMADLDQDGCMDLFVVNGHIDNSGSNPEERMEAQLFSYRNQRWRDLSEYSGDWFRRKMVSRGATWVDFDMDGRIDLGISNQNDRFELLRNASASPSFKWIKAIGVTSNRSGIGTKLRWETSRGWQSYEISGGGSYCSSSWLAIPWFPDSQEIKGNLEIVWPKQHSRAVEFPHIGGEVFLIENPAK
ncbi:FG-GAP repeat domain-containing protein [Pirellulaceae bacterium SH449]